MFKLKFLFAAALTPLALPQVQVRFDSAETRWILSNGWVEAVFQLTPAGAFEFRRLADLGNGGAWSAPPGSPSSPLRFRLDSRWYDAQTPYRLLNQTTQTLPGMGRRQTIVLEDLEATVRVELDLEMYPGHPVLRSSVRLRNLRPQTVYVRGADMLPWKLKGPGQTYSAFRVTQWVVTSSAGEFQPQQSALRPGGPPFLIVSGAHGRHCGWLAVRDESARGLLAGWEFDGRAQASISQAGEEGYLKFNAQVLALNHPLPPGDGFQVPPAFLGLFTGDWDEAGYRTQAFTEAALAKPPPDPERFPFVGWDSWGYEENIHEQILRRNAEIAARLGMELFIVDLGWARRLGDWHADPEKFPGGLRALSDYVHSLGMKFGLHFALTEAHPDSPVLQEHPDWTSSETYHYHGGLSLCLGHRPTQEWLVAQAVRMIDDYGVDWILQDGENMVKECTKSTHTHDPQDSNYANAVDGLNAVVEAIQKLRPQAHWENCENGGNMMTFNMVRYYVTSITNDASGTLGARRGVWGATYPFPPRYTDRYMPEEKLDQYTTRSYMFGGPWLFMGRLAEMSAGDLELAAAEISLYKTLRPLIRQAKIGHLTGFPDGRRTEAIQACDPVTGTAVAFVTRHAGPEESYRLRFRGLQPGATYRVSFDNSPATLTLTGAQLMATGVRVPLPAPHTTEIVFAETQ